MFPVWSSRIFKSSLSKYPKDRCSQPDPSWIQFDSLHIPPSKRGSHRWQLAARRGSWAARFETHLSVVAVVADGRGLGFPIDAQLMEFFIGLLRGRMMIQHGFR